MNRPSWISFSSRNLSNSYQSVMSSIYENFPRASQPFHLPCPPPPGNEKKSALTQDPLLHEGPEWVFSEGDILSTSPITSLRSSQSSPSEIGGDSGVCSEHDTPPPLTRKQRIKRTVLSSDSDNDSSSSSPEVHLQDFIQSPAEPSSSVSLERSGSTSSSGGDGSDDAITGNRAKALARKKMIACRIIGSQSKPLPSSLLREIKEKSRELKKRRQAIKEASIENAEKNHTNHTNQFTPKHASPAHPAPFSPSSTHPTIPTASSSSRQKNGGRVSRLQSHFQSLTQDVAHISLAESSSSGYSSSTISSTPPLSNYSSMASVHTEEDDYFPSNSSDYYPKPLFECRDESAGSGFAGFNNIFAPQQEATIRSSKGTVRGVKNRVRAGIATFNSDHRFLKVSVALRTLLGARPLPEQMWVQGHSVNKV